MYKSPKLEVLGSLRELTLAGGSSGLDTFGVNPGNPGCVEVAPNTFVCKTS